MMNKDFDPITEFPVHSSEFGAGESVHVYCLAGWGGAGGVDDRG